jgi:uncharacterized metal-binding protein YceD (DUF177 family)
VVRSEEEAAQRDDLESELDVVVGSRRFGLEEWLEDELILALPAVVFHDQCEGLSPREPVAPQAYGSDSEGGASTRNPFAALGRLKKAGPE